VIELFDVLQLVIFLVNTSTPFLFKLNNRLLQGAVPHAGGALEKLKYNVCPIR
jgi:hypothetical protein